MSQVGRYRYRKYSDTLYANQEREIDMMRGSRSAGVISALALAVAVGLAPSVVFAADGLTGPDDESEQEQQAVADPTIDDDYWKTVEMMQEAGINELNPEFAGTYLLDGSIDGQATLEYYESAPGAKKLLTIIQKLNKTAPVPIVPKPTTVHIGKIQDILQKIVTPEAAAALGITDLDGANFNMQTGRVVMYTFDPAVVERIREVHGKASIDVEGISIEVAFRERTPLERALQAASR